MIYVTEGVNEWNRGCSAGTGFTSNTMYTMADSRFGANSTALDLDYVPLHTPLYLFVDSRANDANGAGPYTIKFKDVVVGSVASPWPLNFALPWHGGVVSASSEYPGFPASAANNGDRRGLNWANGGIWNDNSRNVYPDFLQIDLAGTKTIDEIDVIAVQDNYQNPTEPTLADIFTQYGVTSFEIQYWNGSTWVTVPGGSVTANNKVWTKVTFTPIETAKIRVLVNGALQGYSRLAEVEAWGLPPAPTPTPTPTPTPEPTATPTPTPDPTPIPDPPPPGPTNFALATNGGTVQSSSQYSDAYPAAAIINGDRRGLNWGMAGAGMTPPSIHIRIGSR